MPALRGVTRVGLSGVPADRDSAERGRDRVGRPNLLPQGVSQHRTAALRSRREIA